MDVNNAVPNNGFSGMAHCTAVITLEPNPTKSNSILRFSLIYLTYNIRQIMVSCGHSKTLIWNV